jgi:hypothetical protein
VLQHVGQRHVPAAPAKVAVVPPAHP